MTLNIIDSKLTATVTAQTSFSQWWVTDDAYVATNGTAIDSTGISSNKAFFIDGAVIADGVGLRIGDTESDDGGDNVIQVGEGGRVRADATAILSDSPTLRLVNAGEIASSGGPAVAMNANNLEMTNTATGQIVGDTDGIRVVGNQSEIENYGLVSTFDSSSEAVRLSGDDNQLVNHGSISSDGDAVYGVGDRLNIYNAGDITAQSTFSGDGILVFGNGTRVVNDGTVTVVGTGQGIRFGDATQTELLNRGVINAEFRAVSGSSGNDTLVNRGSIFGDFAGFTGADTVDNRGGEIVGTIRLGSNADTLYAGVAPETVDGGNGADTVIYEMSEVGVDVRLSNGKASGGHASGDSLTDVENLIGSAYADFLGGTMTANELHGGVGDDVLYAGRGDDILVGGVGADRLIGGDGSDTADYSESEAAVDIRIANGTGAGGYAEGDVLVGVESAVGTRFVDYLVGNSGDNTFTGGDEADVIRGGKGVDTLSYETSNAAVDVRIYNETASGGHADGDTFSGFENLIGSAFDDTLVGNAAANSFAGLDGADRIFGGGGLDTVDYSASNDEVSISLQTGSVSGGHATGDQLSQIENVIGSEFQDLLVGTSGTNVLEGGGGNDTLVGEAGADTLIGGAGRDDLASYTNSQAGVDVRLSTGIGTGGDADGDVLEGIENLTGSAFGDVLGGDGSNNEFSGLAGNDRIFLGQGIDRVYFAPGDDADRVLDYRTTTDYLDLTVFNFNTFSDVQALASQVGNDTVIDFGGGDEITLVGVTSADLNEFYVIV